MTLGGRLWGEERKVPLGRRVAISNVSPLGIECEFPLSRISGWFSGCPPFRNARCRRVFFSSSLINSAVPSGRPVAQRRYGVIFAA
jgi:hypothetical protein